MPQILHTALYDTQRATPFARCVFTPTSKKNIICFTKSLESLPANWRCRLLPFVTAQELATAKRFTRTLDAACHLTGRAIIRWALTVFQNKPFRSDFAYTEYGKPYVAGSNMHFSISHSGEMVCVALCQDVVVGIDVEKVQELPDIMGMAALLHPAENTFLHNTLASERTAAFYRCWTRKESLLKAAGVGLSVPLNTFQVALDNRKHDWIVSRPDQGTTAGWTSSDIEVKTGYQCSMAVCMPEAELTVFHL